MMNLERRGEALKWLAEHSLPALPVAPIQDSYKFPKMVRGKDGEYHAAGKEIDGSFVPDPLFTGKNPSYLDSSGIPRIVKHIPYQNRLPNDAELQKWFANPNNGVMTMGGWGRIAWVDFDAKQFYNQQECDRAVVEWLEQHPSLKETFTEKTQSGGWRFAVKLKEDPTFTNFALAPGGKHLGEVLWHGRLTVLAPTVGPTGNPYVSLRRCAPIEVNSLEEIGIYSIKSQVQTNNIQPTEIITLPPLDTRTRSGSVHLADLVTDRVRNIINGSNEHNDRSYSLTVAAKELYGWEAWSANNGVPTTGVSDELIDRAGQGMGLPKERIERIIKTINPSQCQPAALLHGEASCWKKVKRLSREIYTQRCPENIKTQIAAQMGRAVKTTQMLIDKTYPELGQFLCASKNTQPPSTPAIETLRAWYRVARAIDRPATHLNEISAVANAVKAGAGISLNVIKDMQRDYDNYWNQIRTAIQASENIVAKKGISTGDGGWQVNGKNYHIYSDKHQLIVKAKEKIPELDRGIILQVQNGQVLQGKIIKEDVQKFVAESQKCQFLKRTSSLDSLAR